ncbi:hypothetical protein E1N52_21355 [Paraburkholderia guartelaensis]|uniref:Uncharacterized protein n=1 Tax=Paraburkholderia guartelaensis TaxID=2546446 RepID=A0A4R5LBN2_9BURK|nr:hypothetical protein [Paraburkholderia guartelaensis]TDG06111.1 hypothetical protein E1N52_21355 [Paraburkholderia guartelaensis]
MREVSSTVTMPTESRDVEHEAAQGCIDGIGLIAFTTFTPDNTLMSIVKASLSLSRMAYVGRLAQPNWTRAMRLRVIFQTARLPSAALTRSEHSGFFRGEI